MITSTEWARQIEAAAASAREEADKAFASGLEAVRHVVSAWAIRALFAQSERDGATSRLAEDVRARLGPRGYCFVTWDVNAGPRAASIVVGVKWARQYSGGAVSDERRSGRPTVDDALRAVLEHEDEADAREAREGKVAP